MKSILSASLCTAALAFAVPAMAQTDSGTPMHHHHHHHSSRMDHMQGPKTRSKRAGDPSTEDLNAKSLAAARNGSAPANGDNTMPMSTAPGTGMAAPSGSGMAAPSGSGMSAPSGMATPPDGMTSSNHGMPAQAGSGMAAPSTMPSAGGAPSSGNAGMTTPSNAPGGQ